MPARFLCALLLGLAGAANAAPPAADHPILGTWEFEFQDRDCTETYRFYANGRTLDTSGEEVTESAYEISARPAGNGFYKLQSKITKGNGKKDCAGQLSKVGEGATNYVLFHRTGESFIMCKAANLEACFGPLQKVHGKPA
jgi:hypothetical protein